MAEIVPLIYGPTGIIERASVGSTIDPDFTGGVIWLRTKDTVLASSTKNILVTPNTKKALIIYFVAHHNDDSKIVQYHVRIKTGVVTWNSHGVIGGGLNYSVNFSIVGSDIVMSLSNNELFDIGVDLVRLEMASV